MVFCWWVNYGPLTVVCGSSLPSTKKKHCQSWTPSDKTFWIPDHPLWYSSSISRKNQILLRTIDKWLHMDGRKNNTKNLSLQQFGGDTISMGMKVRRVQGFLFYFHSREISQTESMEEQPCIHATHYLDTLYMPTKYYQNIFKGYRARM